MAKLQIPSEVRHMRPFTHFPWLISDSQFHSSSSEIRKRVVAARKIQAERYKNEGIFTNSELSAEQIKKYCKLDEASENIMKLAAQKYQLSGRRYARILKIARTIADLAGAENIISEHITQALQYRET